MKFVTFMRNIMNRRFFTCDNHVSNHSHSSIGADERAARYAKGRVARPSGGQGKPESRVFP
ncbi:Uncharacterised protein [Bordetella pertussis]|nr:Uncharacterised protein [Bordetella pertussis]